MKKFLDIAMPIVLALVMAVIIAVIYSLPVMWIWNWLMPEICGFAKIGFGQALGLCVLGSFLAGSNSKGSSK